VLATPKAFANFSPGLERSNNPGSWVRIKVQTLKGLGMCAANPFRVECFFCNATPRVLAALEPWAEIS
jgi:hypothetical protein